MEDAATFPTNEFDWPSKVNKVRKIFVKWGGGRKQRNSLTATAGKHKNYENWEYFTYCNGILPKRKPIFYSNIFFG